MKQKRGQAKKRKYPVSELEDKHNESILEEVLSISGKNTLQSDEMDSVPTDQKNVSNGKVLPSKETDVSSAAKLRKATTKEKAPILNEKDHKTKKDSANENTSTVEDESSTAKSKKDDTNDKAALVGKSAPSVARLKRSAANEKSKEKGEMAKPTKKKATVTEEKVVSSEEKSPSPTIKKKRGIANKKLASSNTEREETAANVPDGWRRESVIRKTGKTAGQIDVYFYSPEGIKLRSRPDVASYISKHKCNLKVEDFDFSKRMKSGNKGKSAGNDVSANKNKIVHEEKEVDGEATDEPKSVPPKQSKLSDKMSTKVPDSPTNVGGKNSDKKESGKILLRITEPEPKKVRK